MPSSQKTFTPTKRGNPCGICSDTSGDCRELQQGGYLCHSLSDGFQSVPGYEYKGLSKNSVWGIWSVSTSDFSQQERDQWQQQQQAIKAQRQADEKKRRADAMAADERDRYYRKLEQQLPLAKVDKTDLINRGLSPAEIKNHGYVTAEQWQRLDRALPHTLPGVSLTGRSLNVGEAGYLCPIRNVKGQIIGYQVRRRADGEGGRYRWLTSRTKKRPNGAGPHLKNGEMPLSVFRSDSTTLGFAEGTGPKPHIASLRLGINVIGAAGGNWAGAPEQLTETIADIKPEQFVLYPDAGAVANAGVMAEYQKLYDLLADSGHTLQVAWWGQTTKDADDIDELNTEELATIQLLSWSDFSRMAPKSEGKPKLSIKPDFEFSQGYLGEQFGDLPTPNQEKIILLQAGKGSGKSTAIKKHCQSSSQKVDAITYRDALVLKTSKEIGLGYRTNDHPGGISLCIDSAHPTSAAKFKADEHQGNILLMDEAVSVVRHGVFSSTCRKERGHIWPEIEKRIHDATDPKKNGQLILSDADLDDATVNFLLSFAHPDAAKPFYIRQKPQPKKGKVIRYTDSKELLSAALSSAQQGDRLWMCVSGQTAASAKGSKNLEKYFAKKGIDSDQVLRLDSETIKLKSHPAFGFLSMDAEQQINLLTRYKVILATSAIEAGVSVDLHEHFAAVYGLFTGVVSPSAARQALSRVRDFSIDRHVFAADMGLPNSFIANRQTTAEGLMKSQAKKTSKLREKMAEACFAWGEDEQRPVSMVEVMAYWAKSAAEHNRQMLKYADHVFEGLESEGWHVERASDAAALATIKEELAAIKDEQQALEDEQVSLAESISEEDASELKQRQSLEDGDLEKLAKHDLEKRYATTYISPALVRADSNGAYPGLKMMYLLTVGQPYETAHLAAEISSLKGKTGAVFSPDIDRKDTSGIRDVLKQIGIAKLLKFNTDFWRGDRTVVRVWANIRANKQAIESLLNIDLERCGAIGGINKILAATIGTRLKKVGKQRKDKKQVPIYRFEGLPFDDVLARWLERDHRAAIERGEITDYKVLLNGGKMPTFERKESTEDQLNLGRLLVEHPTTSRSTKKTARPTAQQALQTMGNWDLKTLIRSFLLGPVRSQTKQHYLDWLSTRPCQEPSIEPRVAKPPSNALRYIGGDYPDYQGIDLFFVSTALNGSLTTVKTASGELIHCLPSKSLNFAAEVAA